VDDPLAMTADFLGTFGGDCRLITAGRHSASSPQAGRSLRAIRASLEAPTSHS